MRFYHVFDCTRNVGITCTVPTAFLAVLICCLVGGMTGRLHDYWESNLGAML